MPRWRTSMRRRQRRCREREYGITRQRVADILHVTQHFYIGGIIGIGVRRRRVRTGDDQFRRGFPLENVGQHFAHEPIDGDAVGVVSKAAHEEHGERLADGRAELVAGRIDARAQAGAQTEIGTETQQIVAIRRRADLHLVEPAARTTRNAAHANTRRAP